MPFTLAHPALILPLNKTKRLSLTALVAGSMVPDFEFFFQLREVENIGHHWMGIFVLDVPMALLFCFLFHGVLRNILITNLPNFYRRRFIQYIGFNWLVFAFENKVRVTISAFIGVFTHLLWDAFTHHDGFFVEAYPLLNSNIQILSVYLPVYYLLQVVFSLSGMLILIISIHQLPVEWESSKDYQNNRMFWPLFLMILVVILIIRIVGWPQYNSFWGVVMALMGATTYSLLLTSILIKKYNYELN